VSRELLAQIARHFALPLMREVSCLKLLMSIPILETDRLLLRGFREADASDVQALAGRFEIADTTLTIPHPYEDGMAEEWIAQHEGAFKECRGVTFAITFKSDGSLVGAISLMGIEAGHQAELGYWVGVPYWGQGVCTEAGTSTVAYAFSDLGLIRLHARHLSRNPSSGRVLQKVGFVHEGCRRSHVRKWGKFEDVEEYGLLHRSLS
jgi:[ribosomal protein S5]-alanine N-acetyltransferase